MARSTETFPRGRWQARWIWFEGPRLRLVRAFPIPVLEAEVRTPRTGALRKRFRVDARPVHAWARLTADSRYILWVNGREAARGPVRDHPTRLHYDVVDLAPYLVEGENVLAVLVRFYGEANAWWMPAVPSGQLGAGAFVFEAKIGPGRWILSDHSWKARAFDGWVCLEPSGIGARGSECVDGRTVPEGWQAPGFDDAEWSDAVELETYSLGYQGEPEPPSTPYGSLLPRPVALLGCVEKKARLRAEATCERESATEAQDPVVEVEHELGRARVVRRRRESPEGPLELRCREGRSELLHFDFGEVVCGTLALEVDAAGGAVVDVLGSEFDPAFGKAAPPRRLGEEHRAGVRYVAPPGRSRVETFDPVGLRHVVLSVRSSGTVRIGVSVEERLHPRARGPFFECSDERLERIWKAGRRTVDLCSLDAYVDCPTREQRAWTGDAVVHQMVDLVSNADWRLARWCVELAARPRPDGMLPMAAACDLAREDASYVPDWALHWIHALHNLYRYTGDREFVARMLPVAENVLRWFLDYRAEDGLLADVPGWVLVDWAAVGVGGRSSVLNALWARALGEFEEMAAWLGDGGRAFWAQRLREELREAFEAFWDPERGRYADTIRKGRRSLASSQHAQAAAVVAGLAPPERSERLLELLVDSSLHVEAAWSAPRGRPTEARAPEGGIGGAYLFFGPEEPWWDVETKIVAAQPFFRYVVHDAVARLGAPEAIARLCLDWERLLERAPTFSETWYAGTTCHGWSSTPTRDLLCYTLGVTPAEPGFALARVAPRLGFLEWARGAVPTPLGLLFVEASREKVRVESPVPFDLVLEDGTRHRFGVGTHEVSLGRGPGVEKLPSRDRRRGTHSRRRRT
ncbi:MAG: hypothetical protein KatS3mg076_2976 [Candidatus Binatia bacterium]|nr:MAG: hypothetical protein KatS3mg076_2976 [Candidatus Binatia bacterium]